MESGEPLRAVVTVYADMTEIKVSGHTQRGGGRRGGVTRFTSGSRKRMLNKLARIREDFRTAHFMTLTYPGAFSRDPRIWKRDLDVMLKRVRRKFPDACGIWRIEFQKRGAPHFHLIVWNMIGRAGKLREWASRAWFEVVGSGDLRHYRAGTDFTALKNRKRAGRYVSKYSAKITGGCPVDLDTGEVVHVGRWWGTFGAMSMGAALGVVLSLRSYHLLRRSAARLLKARGVAYWRRLARLDPTRGCTVYGLGDKTVEAWASLFDSTVFRMIQYAL